MMADPNRADPFAGDLIVGFQADGGEKTKRPEAAYPRSFRRQQFPEPGG